MKALVTGGAGFIGSHLVDFLLDLGWQVHVVDNLSTGSMVNFKRKTHPNLQFSLDSVCAHSFDRYVSDVDVVFHLAAAVGVAHVLKFSIDTLRTNVIGTSVVLEACAKYGKPVLITSTSETYGKSDSYMFNESDDLILGPTDSPKWGYAGSKIINELFSRAYYEKQNLPVIVTRLFNTIGPRQSGRYGMVVPRFISQAKRNEPITVYGDGLQKRSFTWVDDVVRALVQLVQTPAAVGQIINVGHTNETSILDLANMVRTLTQSSSEIIFIPYKEVFSFEYEDTRRRLPNLSKIKALIGYAPTLQLPEMLERIIGSM